MVKHASSGLVNSMLHVSDVLLTATIVSCRFSFYLNSVAIPAFGVSTVIMLSSRNFPQVGQVGLYTLARKR